MITLILSKDAKPEKFKCQVCQEEYASSLEALNCPEKHGYPRNKFSAGQVVIVTEGINKGLIGEIKSISFAKPENTTRPVHSPLYLIKVEKIESGNSPLPNFTTAREGEIKIYEEA